MRKVRMATSAFVYAAVAIADGRVICDVVSFESFFLIVVDAPTLQLNRLQLYLSYRHASTIHSHG